MTDLEARCTYSDLPTATCVHCVGDDPTILPGEATYTDPPAHRLAPMSLETARDVYKPRPKLEPTLDPAVTVARNLRAILDMTRTDLTERSIDLAADHDMPGGDALVALAPVAMPSQWERRTELAEAAWMAAHAITQALGTRVAATDDDRPTLDDDDDFESPLQALLYWSEDWRRQLDMDYGLDPTLISEASFLANADVLTWARGHEKRWDHFADTVATVRTRVENIVRDGERETRSRVTCDKCDKPRRLILVHGKGNRPDVWKCPSCKARFDADALHRAHARQMRAEGAARWVDRTEAIGVLRAQGWQERVIRGWLADDPDLATRVYDVAGRVAVWWPDVWRKHLIETQARADRKRLAAERKVRRDACEEAHGPDCWERGQCTHTAVA